jgi:hypothetical protein
MGLVDRSLAERRGGDRRVQQLGHLEQLVPRASGEHAASGDDRGPGRLAQNEHGLADGRRIGRGAQVG